MSRAIRPDSPGYIADQPHPSAVGSMVTLCPSVYPSRSPARSAIVNVIPEKSAAGRATRHVDSASVITGASASSVSGRSAGDPVGAEAANIAPSLSTIVTVPVPVAITAPPIGLDSTTVNDSVGSFTLSPTIVTAKLTVVVPGAKLSVAVFETKSLPAVALPATVVTTTVIV